MGSSFSSITTSRFLYAGTYTAPHTAPGASTPAISKGIAIYCLSGTGQLDWVGEVETENPSSLAMNATNTVLYAVNELGEDDTGAPLGTISAFSVEWGSGALTLLNKQPTKGSWPCHCSVHPSGKFVLAANYGSGEFMVFPIGADGALLPASDFVTNPGRGHDAARQTGPHAHMILTEPVSNRVYGVDLGLDRVFAWSLDEDSGRLTAANLPYAQMASGAGPRHMVFSEDGQSAFVLNELASTVDVFDVAVDTGAFIGRQTVSMLPEASPLCRPVFDPENPGFIPEDANTGAEIRLHPNGKWLYATNRGMNTVVQFEIDGKTQDLSPVAWTSSQGGCPRGMILSEDGNVLIVGNQNSNSIAVFSIDPDSGWLGEPIQTLAAPTPVDFVFGADAG